MMLFYIVANDFSRTTIIALGVFIDSGMYKLVR